MSKKTPKQAGFKASVAVIIAIFVCIGIVLQSFDLHQLRASQKEKDIDQTSDEVASLVDNTAIAFSLVENNATEAPVSPTEAPVSPTEAPVSPTEAPIIEEPTTAEPSAAPTPLKGLTPGFTKFLMHIPKSGTSYAFSIIARMGGLVTGIDGRPCNVATTRKRAFEQKYQKEYRGKTCNLWMSERPWSRHPLHTYAILRDPRTHTLSMFFHCAESKDHASMAWRMQAGLTDWLENYVDAKRNANASMTVEEHEQLLDRKYLCYNPINFQKRWIKPVIYDDIRDINATTTSAISDGRAIQEEPQQPMFKISHEDLFERYDVIGDQAQMDKTICMIFTHYKGVVIEPCDCTNDETVDDTEDDTTNNATTMPHIDHGVSHHGDSFEMTPEQEEMIAFLRDEDMILYDETRKVFAEQVRRTEEQYGVKICDKIKPFYVNGKRISRRKLLEGMEYDSLVFDDY